MVVIERIGGIRSIGMKRSDDWLVRRSIQSGSKNSQRYKVTF
jgi:hypothetical protein